ncbi:TonB-dependent receptor domain-containing protein [Sphingosinicella sp. LY1275]|uniref:TonB-dependent receptor domain-containing protein n=1 Tax=Sphingosinicella sp. LY1275 TaxID=3095379 RepID=UPI002ADEC349|nr:TonB-dependent receptor [Sphingosinicella sp. LY1275]MEA1013819.1 TonB-dependent receptor [Sphingosinicella sp. LY1275]
MRKLGLLGSSALRSAVFIGATIAVAAPASAQAQDDSATLQSEAEIESGQAASSDQAITVTGSRIRRPNLDSAVPITSVGGEEFFETGQISVGDVLNELPQLRSTFSQQNSTRFLGTRGLNLLDLRGLGTSRTLVLVNGRRHVAGDVLVNAVSPDTNTFPTDLIERVDIVTGAGSSIYGSDAIAGAVNFILKKDYEGVQVRGQAGVSKYGDAGNQYVSVLAGTNFADGRGNVAINAEFAHQDRYFGSGRPALRQNDAFVVVDTDGAGSVNGSDGNPDRVFFRDIRSTTISTGGQVGVRFANSAAAPCGTDNVGAAFTCASLFNPDGSLVSQTGTRVGLGPNGNFVGGNGYVGREGELLTLSPQLDRYSVNLIGHYEFSPAFVPFIEAKYVRSEAFGSQSGPFFSQGQTLGDSVAVTGLTDTSYFLTGAAAGRVNREGIRLDNPFLSAAARSALTTQLLATTVNPNTGAALTPAQLAAQRAQIADGSFRFSLRKNFVEFGIRDEKFVRETYRAVTGVRGEFNDDWNYEVSLNYGEHREKNKIQSNINRQRFLLALDAVDQGLATTGVANGNIVCRSQVSPAYAGNDRAGDPAQLAADIAACVPLNPFGVGASSQAVRDYLTVQSSAEGKITQFVASGYVAGDSSQLFELPGGPVGFSVGAEYRRETTSYDLDDLTQAGYAFYNAIPSFSAPSFEVKEAFGEVSLPILKDVPFFQELTLSGSGRVADYKGSTGTVYSYGGDVTWRPVQDFALRGSYNRAVRAPNLSELYSEQSQNFAPAPNDPCSARNLAAGSSTRAANCTAAGRPAGYDFVYTSSLEIVSGGNPNLKEETSDNYTVGGLFTPSFIPGLSISADYFDITVNDVITSVSAQQILNSCYDAATLDNPFCALFKRAPSSGGPRGEQAFRVEEGSLLQSTLNFASLKVRGVDTEVAYRKTFDWGSTGLRLIWTHTLQNDQFTNPADPGRANRLLYELGDPQDEVNFNANVKVGAFTLGYQFRWIEKMVLNTHEDLFSVQGRAPENADYADIRFYPSVSYHDARFDVKANERLNVYIGVDNITNRMPPFGLTGVGAGSGIYDVRGRYFYAGAVAKF